MQKVIDILDAMLDGKVYEVDINASIIFCEDSSKELTVTMEIADDQLVGFAYHNSDLVYDEVSNDLYGNVYILTMLMAEIGDIGCDDFEDAEEMIIDYMQSLQSV